MDLPLTEDKEHQGPYPQILSAAFCFQLQTIKPDKGFVLVLKSLFRL